MYINQRVEFMFSLKMTCHQGRSSYFELFVCILCWAKAQPTANWQNFDATALQLLGTHIYKDNFIQ